MQDPNEDRSDVYEAPGGSALYTLLLAQLHGKKAVSSVKSGDTWMAVLHARYAARYALDLAMARMPL